MSRWVRGEDGGVLHLVLGPLLPTGRGVYRRGPAFQATSACLCYRVKVGEIVTLGRRGTAAIRCGQKARARGLDLPLAPVDWRKKAVELALAVQTGEGRREAEEVLRLDAEEPWSREA